MNIIKILSECKTIEDFRAMVAAWAVTIHPEIQAISDKLEAANAKKLEQLRTISKLRIDPRARSRHETGLKVAAQDAGLDVKIEYVNPPR